jgi:type IV pilus assembly protein PilV
LILLNDMASRIAANRANAATYVTGGTPLGGTAACPGGDAGEWCNALEGAAEISGGNVGAMIGGRGCVDDLGGGEYLVTVAWQGLRPTAAPPAGVTCGQTLYDGGAGCTGDLCRRTVTTIINAAPLS